MWLLRADIISIDWSLAGFMIPELHGLAFSGKLTRERAFIRFMATMTIARDSHRALMRIEH